MKTNTVLLGTKVLLIAASGVAAVFAGTPAVTIAFFDGTPAACPVNWDPLAEADGYLLVATSDPANKHRGDQIGVAL